MRLKSFYAKSMTEAMSMVRENLGENAVIVATREERGSGGVRVTAAVEQEDHHDAPARGRERDAPYFEVGTRDEPVSAREWLQYDSEDNENAVIEQLTDLMIRHGVADEITDQVVSCATVMSMESADVALIAALEHLYSFRPLPQKQTAAATMLVGPPGAGKTLTAAKLAARGVMAGMKVAVISTDTVRAGGIEQLAAFTKIMRAPLHKAGNPQDLRAALEDARGFDQVVIDTGGFNPFAANEMRDLARLVACGDIEPVLVMPAGMDADESGEMARVYAALGVRAMMPARVDIARRLGGLLGAAHHGGLIFADAGNTPKVADGLIPLSPERLAHLLMPQAAGRRKNSSSQTPLQTRKRVMS